jgi:hypothetical protein
LTATDDILAPLGIIDAPIDGLDVDAVRLGDAPGAERFFHANPQGNVDAALIVHDHDGSVRWALLEWVSSNTDGTDMRYEVEACGWGVGGPLREARHTYFGDEGGYIHDVSPSRLAWAFGVLGKWFDFA